MAPLLLALALLQDPSALAESLGSADPAVREKAEAELRGMAEKARPALEAAARGANAEAAARARYLLRLLEARKVLTPNLLAAIPAAAERFTRGDFLSIYLDQLPGRRGPLPRIQPEDLEPLLERALDAAREPGEMGRFLGAARSRGHEAALLPHVVRRLEDPDWPFAPEALAFLEQVEPGRPWKQARALLASADPRTLRAALTMLARGGERLPPAFENHADPGIRGFALENSPDLARVEEGLDDPDPDVRRLCAARLVRAWTRTEDPDVQGLAGLLGHARTDVVETALGVLSDFGFASPGLVPALLPLLDDPEEGVSEKAWSCARNHAGFLPRDLLMAWRDGDDDRQFSLAIDRLPTEALGIGDLAGRFPQMSVFRQGRVLSELAERKLQAVLPLLRATLGNPDAADPDEAIAHLLRMGTAEDLPLLRSLWNRFPENKDLALALLQAGVREPIGDLVAATLKTDRGG